MSLFKVKVQDLKFIHEILLELVSFGQVEFQNYFVGDPDISRMDKPLDSYALNPTPILKNIFTVFFLIIEFKFGSLIFVCLFHNSTLML